VVEEAQDTAAINDLKVVGANTLPMSSVLISQTILLQVSF
jgi:hypothetical protein